MPRRRGQGAVKPAMPLLAAVLREEPRVHEACLAQLRASRAAGDVGAAGLAATAGLLHTLASYADFRGLDELLQAFEALESAPDRCALVLDPEHALRADAVRLSLPCLDHRLRHDDPALEPARLRLFLAVRDGGGASADERVLLAKLLVDHDGMRNDLAQVERVQALMNEAVHDGRVSPLRQGRWWALVMSNAEYWGRTALAREALGLAQALLHRHALPELALAVARQEMLLALRADDLARAQRAWLGIEQLRAHVRPALLPHGLRAQVALSLRRGDHGAALERTALILALCEDHGVPERDRAGYIELRASACTGLGRHDEAIAILESLRSTQHAGQQDVLDTLIALAKAVQALDHKAAGDPAQPLVQDALQRCAAVGYTRFLSAHPGWAARLAALALDAGVCTEFVESSVRERALAPPELWREAWPWKLRVQLLGGLRVWRDGLPLSGTGGPTPSRPQRRPLELLALLAAHPGGLSAESLIETLWPSLEAEAPKASLEMTITRLRKWLEWPDAVRVVDGRVSLHPGWVFSDVQDFEAACEAGAFEAALGLYRGPLLAGETLSPRLQVARERLAARLCAVLLQAGQSLQLQAKAGQAAALYARGLAAEPTAAALQQALQRV